MTGLCAESDFEKCTHRSGKAMRIETKICSALSEKLKNEQKLTAERFGGLFYEICKILLL